MKFAIITPIEEVNTLGKLEVTGHKPQPAQCYINGERMPAELEKAMLIGLEAMKNQYVSDIIESINKEPCGTCRGNGYIDRENDKTTTQTECPDCIGGCY